MSKRKSLRGSILLLMAVFVAGMLQMISTRAQDSSVFEVVQGPERRNRSESQKKEEAVLQMKVSVVAGVSYTTEDIPLDIIFKNDSEEPVRILDAFNNPAAKRVFFNIVLKDAEGTLIDIGGGWGRIDMSPGYAKYTELKEDETMKIRINLKDYYLTSERLKPGVYSVSVTYRNPYGTNCFKGTLESELNDLVLVR